MSHSVHDDAIAAARGTYVDGTKLYGELGISQECISDRLIAILSRYVDESNAREAADFIARLHLSDLYLAMACGAGNEVAWKCFDNRFRKYIESLCSWIHGAANGPDLAADIFTDLYLPDRSGRSRISSYDGRSSLCTWLRVIVGNRSTNENLRKDNANLHMSAVHEVIDRQAHQEIEAAICARRYEPIVRGAIGTACADLLTDHERLILLWRYDQNLRLGEIAGLLGIHQSTVTRQMERAMKRLRDAAIDAMRKQGLSWAAIEECFALISTEGAGSFAILAHLKKHPGRHCPDSVRQMASMA